MKVSHQATVNGYRNSVWFSENVITNIIALKNLRLKYLVTYRSDGMMFIVHRESEGKPNMQLRMHESGLHYFDQRYQEFTFVNAISDNKEGFTARQIKGVEVARDFYATLIYPSDKDYKWVIHSNHINNCPVTIQDVEVAHKVWGNKISSLKGKTTCKNPNVVARYQVKIPVGLIKLHKVLFLTRNISFVNKSHSS